MTLTTDARSMILIAIVACAVFANTLGGDFVYDDNRQILRNTLIQQPSNYGTALTSDVWAFKGDGSVAASNYYRPVFTLWSIALWKLFGANPFGWHLFNILLHVLASLLAFRILRIWEIPLLPALAGGLIFAVHPVHAESVAWIAGSPDLLLACGLFGTLILVDSAAADKSKLKFSAALVCYAFALGSKEVAFACLPIIALFFICRGDGLKKSLIATLPFAALAAAFFFIRWRIIGVLALPVEDPPTVGSAILSAPQVFTFYIGQILFPVTLSGNYPLRPVDAVTMLGFVVPLLVTTTVVILIAIAARGSRRGMAAAAIFLLALLPAFNLTAFPNDQIVHDRYLYVPLLGFIALFLLAVKSFDRPEFTRNAAIALLVLSIPLAVRTFVYNAVWTSDLALWSHTATIDPNSASTLNNYGSVLSLKGRSAAAAEVFGRAIEIDPKPLALNGRGRSLMALGRFDEADADFRRVIALANDRVNAYTLYQSYEALALSLTQRGRADDALAELKAGRARLPAYAAAMTEKIAVVLYQKGEKPAALAELEATRDQARRELLPESKQIFLRLGMLYAEAGRREDARRALTDFLNLTVNSADQAANRAQAATILKSIGPN